MFYTVSRSKHPSEECKLLGVWLRKCFSWRERSRSNIWANVYESLPFPCMVRNRIYIHSWPDPVLHKDKNREKACRSSESGRHHPHFGETNNEETSVPPNTGAAFCEEISINKTRQVLRSVLLLQHKGLRKSFALWNWTSVKSHLKATQTWQFRSIWASFLWLGSRFAKRSLILSTLIFKLFLVDQGKQSIFVYVTWCVVLVERNVCHICAFLHEQIWVIL